MCGFHVDPDAVIEDLPVGVQQRVEIIKVLNREARYVVFDEPTAVLTPQEVDRVLHHHPHPAAGRQRDHLHHPQAGRGARGRRPDRGDAHRAQGRRSAPRRHRRGTPRRDDGGPARRAGGPQGHVAARRLGAAGEGPGGARRPRPPRRRRRHIRGQGRRDRRCGRRPGQRADRADRGDHGAAATLEGAVSLDGVDVIDYSPRQLHKAGVSHIPEDRQESGLVLGFTVAENMVLDSYYEDPFSRGLFMDWDDVNETAARLVEAVRRAYPRHPRPGIDVVGRQPAEGDRRPRVRP